ncbi:hypothetical protein J1614_003234 [Plenodomus biglobosus]|nr:hypothetical protein J1614_003234 [Plenodomus biglobosus]
MAGTTEKWLSLRGPHDGTHRHWTAVLPDWFDSESDVFGLRTSQDGCLICPQLLKRCGQYLSQSSMLFGIPRYARPSLAEPWTFHMRSNQPRNTLGFCSD